MEEGTIENIMFRNAWVRKCTKSLKICFNNPRNTTVSAGLELNMKPLLCMKCLTIKNILHFQGHRSLILQNITPLSLARIRRREFAVTLLDRLDIDNNYLKKYCLKIASFYLSGKVNWHDVKIWGSENSPFHQEHTINTLKIRTLTWLFASKYWKTCLIR